MSSFGQELKRERELRDISLKEISEATKISIRFLEALEQDNFDILPGGVFNRGFIRAYARFIGIDGEEMVNAYLHEVSLREQRRAAEGREPAPAPTAPAPAPSAPPAPPRNRGGRPRAEGYLDGIRSESLAGLRARDASASTGRRAVLDVVEGHASAALWAIAVIAFLVGAGMITLNVLQRTSEASPPDAHAQAARARQARLARSGSGAATDDPAASAGAEAAPQAPPPGDSNAPSDAATAPPVSGEASPAGAALQPVAPPYGGLPPTHGRTDSAVAAVPAAPPVVAHQLWVRATEATQVTIQCAGRVVLHQELWPGLERRLDCPEPVILGATNAGALLYSLDGGPAGLLGDEGQEVVGAQVAPPPPAPAGEGGDGAGNRPHAVD